MSLYNPFQLPPHPAAQRAAAEVVARVHAYMRMHPDSELHRQGKMFGVLVVESEKSKVKNERYLAAFSAMLDGSYEHEGFVPPVYAIEQPPVGTGKAESQRLQRLLFANYRFLNGHGESKSLIDIFANEKPIVPKEEFFDKSRILNHRSQIINPPSGAGECCGPKLLQYAFTHGLKPLAMAEFWVGAPSKAEVRHEGTFYAPCSGKCVPILRHMLQGIDVEPTAESRQAAALCEQIETLYEDDCLIVVNKPSGLLAVPGKTDELSVESHFQFSISHFPFVKAVHRLDQDTSGILVLAKTPEVYKTMQAYFQRRDIYKRYEAIVESTKGQGTMYKGQEGMISLPLLPNPYDRPRQMVDREHGKTAVTKYVIRELRDDGTLFVDFFPLTGRTHQLRVHAAHPEGLNAPIAGDRLYSGYGLQVTGYGLRDTGYGKRLMLHAAEIRFEHPITKEEMHFCIPSGF